MFCPLFLAAQANGESQRTHFLGHHWTDEISAFNRLLTDCYGTWLFQQGILLAILLGIAVALILQTCSSWLGLFHLDDRVIQSSSIYLRAYAWVVPIGLVSLVIEQNLIGMNRQYAVLAITLFGFIMMLVGWWMLVPKTTMPYVTYVHSIV